MCFLSPRYTIYTSSHVAMDVYYFTLNQSIMNRKHAIKYYHDI